MEKRIFTVVSLLFIHLISFAQVACEGTLLMNVNEFCSNDAAYSNIGTPSSGIGVGYCWSDKTSTQEIWFRFNAIGTDVAVAVSGDIGKGTIVKPWSDTGSGELTTVFPGGR